MYIYIVYYSGIKGTKNPVESSIIPKSDFTFTEFGNNLGKFSFNCKDRILIAYLQNTWNKKIRENNQDKINQK